MDSAIYESEHIGPLASHLCAFAALASVVISLVLLLRRRAAALREADTAARAFDPSAPLREGPGFVSGVVEPAGDAPWAVRVEIEQEGQEWKGSKREPWRHQWAEIGRRTRTKPFYLRRPDDERVRVEPGKDVLLVDQTDRTEWIEPKKRKRIAEVRAGEHAIVEGILERGPDPERRGQGGYRDGGSGWVVRPPKGRPLHVSTEPLDKRHRDRASWATTGIAIAVVILVGMLAVAHRYLLRLFAGVTVPAGVVDGQRTSSVMRYVAVLPEASARGEGVTMHLLTAAVLAGLAFVMLVVLLAALQTKRWYEDKLVEEGRGRLPVPDPSALPDPSTTPTAKRRPRRKRKNV